MAATSEMSAKPARSGRWVARAWKYLVRQEIRLARWMVSLGIPAAVATGLLWLTKLALIVVIGYALFWVAIVLAIAFVGMKIFGHADPDAEPYVWEWRQGFLGFGVYDRSGQRIDPHDPTEND